MAGARLAGDVAAVGTRALIDVGLAAVELYAASRALGRGRLLRRTRRLLLVDPVEHRVDLAPLLVGEPCALLAGLTAGGACLALQPTPPRGGSVAHQ